MFLGEKNGSCRKFRMRCWFCPVRGVFLAGDATPDRSGGHAAGGGEVADVQRSPAGGDREAVRQGGQHGQILRCRGNLRSRRSVDLFCCCLDVCSVAECVTSNSCFPVKSVDVLLSSHSQSVCGM